MRVSVFNKAHFNIKIGSVVFPAFDETFINVGSTDSFFKEVRSDKRLRVGKINNEQYKAKYNLVEGNNINMVLDVYSQHNGKAYEHAVKALADPIIKHLDKNDVGYVDRPLKGLNCRFFNSTRIKEHGKCPVGPHDIFFSHGIGDKNYWIGKHIKDFNYAFVPGEAWRDRMIKTGYKGKIYITGYTKLDPLINGEIKENKKDKPYVVWMPTHGYHHKYKGRSSYPQCMKLIEEIPDIYYKNVAMHPTSKLNNKKKHTPTMQDLIDCDVVIADAGSTLYEAWILGKPVIFPDWICKNDVLGHFKKDPDNFEYKIYNENIGYHAKDMDHLISLIDKALSDGMQDREKEFINYIYPEKLRGKAGETAAKYLNELKEELLKDE